MIESIRDAAVDTGVPLSLVNDTMQGQCPTCGFEAHDGVLRWDAETFGELQCDGAEVTGTDCDG